MALMNDVSPMAVATPPLPMLGGEPLIASLLYAVAHDLRSPLLTLSLSMGLLDQAASGGGRLDAASGTLALDAMHHGARDMERMVQALASLARAYRRALNVRRSPVRLLLGGHVVISEEDSLDARFVVVDPLVVREVIDVCCGDDPARVHAALTEEHVVLVLPLPEACAEVRGTPLLALIEGLQRHAGSAIEALAAAQVALERHGAAIEVGDAGVRLWLPRVGASAAGAA